MTVSCRLSSSHIENSLTMFPALTFSLLGPTLVSYNFT